MAKQKHGSAIEAATGNNITQNPRYSRLARKMADLLLAELPDDPDQGEQVIDMLKRFYFSHARHSPLPERLDG